MGQRRLIKLGTIRRATRQDELQLTPQVDIPAYTVLWTRILSDAGLADPPRGDDEDRLAKGIHRLIHIGAPQQLRFLLGHLDGQTNEDSLAARRRAMLHATLWGAEGASMTPDEADARLHANPDARNDLRAVAGRRRHLIGLSREYNGVYNPMTSRRS